MSSKFLQRNRDFVTKQKSLGLCINCANKVVEQYTKCIECRKKDQTRNKRQARLIKQEVITAYGGRCECCQEDTFEFLTIDHINNDGAAHQKIVGGSGEKMYRWLKKNGFPKKGFQLLCFNCNCAKGFFSKCPHKNRV